jgi:DNA-binding CsgD family transcriptional regulator
MGVSDDSPRAVPSTLALGLFLTALGLMALDLTADALGQGGALHVALEAAVMVVLAVGAWMFLQQRIAETVALAETKRRAERLALSVATWREEASRWRNEAESAARGLADAIDRQFERWGLSQSEREVGFLLLKGLALKELADVRGTSERTVRQQAQAIYRKASLGGRAELAAFFLEDLL